MAGELVGASRRYNGRGPTDRRHLGEQVLARRNKGETMYVIAADLGISEDSASRYMQLALDSRLVPTVDEYRRQQNDALDQIEQQNEEQMQLAEHLAREGAKRTNPDLVLRAASLRSEAIRQRVRIAERRAKLNGLDAPVTVNATVTHLDSRDAELEEIANEARAKAAAARERAGRNA